MLKRILKASSFRTIIGSFIYDQYWKDFVFGFCFQKGEIPRKVSLKKGNFNIKITNINDFMTINEVFNWQIYRTDRSEKYCYFFDLGSNIGTSTVYFSKLQNTKKIFCFEPDPKTLKVLKENCVSLGVDVEIMERAITKTGDDVVLNLSTSSRYNSITKIDRFNYVSTVKVKSVSFDDLYNKIIAFKSDEVLIKIDIEGVEDDLLKYLDQKNIYVGDIVVEGEDLPKTFGAYILKNRKFNDMYYYSKNNNI